ncbi:MAG: polyprenyl synthetase family protein [bacterium]|nr:polyprenyl synthetase family protein [bacterium]
MTIYDLGVENMPAYLDLLDKMLKEQSTENIMGINRFLGAGGKRLRPKLIIAIAHHCGKEINDDIIALAASVELIHLASLVHDDIIDNGSIRWGIETINSKEGVDTAILAGDYFIAKGCALATSVSSKAGRILADTVVQLCEGQAMELTDRFNLSRTEHQLKDSVVRKTSSLFKACCLIGGEISKLSQNDLVNLASFCNYFGIAFQYKNDINDFTGGSDKTAKIVLSDAKEGNYTLPIIMTLSGKDGKKLAELLSDPNSGEEIVTILKTSDSLRKAEDAVENYRLLAISKIDQLDNKKLAKLIKAFTEAVL